ncbi:hypothetical protein HGM15179_005265, partial [Zosterops borbonicus]
ISNRVEKFMKLLPTLSKCLFLESTVLHSNGIHTIHNMFCRNFSRIFLHQNLCNNLTLRSFKSAEMYQLK